MPGLFLILINAGCSHTTPYYGPEVSCSAQAVNMDHAVRYRILLIGDAGSPARENEEPILKTLREWAQAMPHRTLVVFLGDNILDNGMPPVADAQERKDAERRLAAQLNVLTGSGARGLFIPGNHDWANGGTDGQDAVHRQGQSVNQALPGDDNFLPTGGCPGPSVQTEAEQHGVRLIVLDTHWWLHREGKPISPCGISDENDVIHQLEDLLSTARGRHVLVVAHHPLSTHGPHGGFFDWKDHLFPTTHLAGWLWLPTPILGSLYPLGRRYLFQFQQDLVGSDNRYMAGRLKDALKKVKPLIYASGHEHSLQVLKGGVVADYFLVSGAGSSEKITPVGHGDHTLFAHSHAGLMAVDFMEDERVLLRVIEPGEKRPVFLMWLCSGAD